MSKARPENFKRMNRRDCQSLAYEDDRGIRRTVSIWAKSPSRYLALHPGGGGLKISHVPTGFHVSGMVFDLGQSEQAKRALRAVDHPKLWDFVTYADFCRRKAKIVARRDAAMAKVAR